MWLMDRYMDLIIWYLADGGIYGFQLCYDKEGDERSLTWLHTGAFTHTRIDSGDTGPMDAKCTPMPVVGGSYDYAAVRQEFLNRSVLIDPELSAFVLVKLAEANLAKLPESAEGGIFLKHESGESGPLSEEELLESIRYGGIVATQEVRFHGEVEWRQLSDFFPDQFPSAPRGKYKQVE